jgi:hypothetical protein
MKRSFFYLAGLTLLSLLVLWVFTANRGSSEKPFVSGLFLPEINKQINDVNRVELVSAGNHTVATMVRTGGHWQLEQMGGYRADWSRLQTLLAALAQANVIEPKTDKPEYYARLGVEDITAGDAGGVLVKLDIGDQTRAILIGHEAQGRPGQYVRLQHSPASALIDRRLDVSTELLDWADSRIVDINASEVAEVEIIHPGGESLLVTRISADQTDFDLLGLPQDREITNSWAVNSLGSVLSVLDMESVRPEDSVDWGDVVKMRLLTFSGMEIIAGVVVDRDHFLLRLRASFPAAEIVNRQAGEGISTGEQTDIEKQAMDDVLKVVDDINEKVAGWAYGISEQKYDDMIKQLENLLKPLEP